MLAMSHYRFIQGEVGCIKQKEGLGCSSVVQRLPSMHEALGSISAPKKKRQKKKTQKTKRSPHTLF
jgi:hypothetical protein